MKRFILLVAVTVLAVLAFCTAAGAAGRTYDNGDLRGTYYFVTMQVRMTYPPGGTEAVAEHCSGYGTVTFDGIGSVVISSTDRCSISGTSTETNTQSYAVNPDGSFIVRNLSDPAYGAHCQLLEHGRTALCDGTTSEPSALSFHVVAVKQ
jgi:hypothetical protein